MPRFAALRNGWLRALARDRERGALAERTAADTALPRASSAANPPIKVSPAAVVSIAFTAGARNTAFAFEKRVHPANPA